MRPFWMIALGATLWAWTSPWAGAEEPSAVEEKTQKSERLCQVFSYDLGKKDVIDTRDRTSLIGQWIGEQRDQGWSLENIDFEVGQKPTAFAQGWTQVCMRR